MRAEIVAIGTELLLGQILDTNSTYMAGELAAAGIDCHFQTRVGDNVDRIADAIEHAFTRADAVICCGGLGPTQDDVTRDALAKVMGVELREEPEARELLESIFRNRNRPMPVSNLHQAEVPQGASIIPQVMGTAPGLICPIGDKVAYAVPGVPDEMKEMLARAILPDLARRSGQRATIRSRTLRTWGLGEAALAEEITPRLDALDAAGPNAPTIAFLASGIEGTKVRITVKADTEEEAEAALAAEEHELRAILGDVVFGVDDETMEYAVGQELLRLGLRLSVAESFTGGLISARIVSLPGASTWFVGGVVAYDSELKHDLLSVDGPVVSEEAAAQMAEGVRKLTGSDVALATTGVAGPDPQEGHPPGTCFAGLALFNEPGSGHELRLIGGRNRIREMATISSLDLLRRELRAR